MNTRLRSFVRPVLALLLIGIIVGLIFIYYDIDDDGVKAEDTTNDTVMSEEIEKEEVKENDSVDEVTYPLRAKDGVINIDGYVASAVLDYGLGYDMILSDAGAVYIGHVENKELTSIEVVASGKYLDSVVWRGGRSVLIANGEDVLLYTIGRDNVPDLKVSIDTVYDARLVVCRDTLYILYRDKEGYRLLSTDTKSILSIDNGSELVGVNIAREHAIELVFGDGNIYEIVGGEVARQVTLPYDIIDIEPVVLEGKPYYAILSIKGDNRYMIVTNLDYSERSRAVAHGDRILFVDRIYVLGSGTMEMYCNCGEYISTVRHNIGDISYIDYEHNRVYYKSTSGDMLSSTMDNGVMTSEAMDSRVIYIDTKLMVITNNTDTQLIYNKSPQNSK